MDQKWRNEVLTCQEAAQMLHVSLPTLYRMITAGIITPAPVRLGVGGRRVIPRADIEHYVDSLKSSARRKLTPGD